MQVKKVLLLIDGSFISFVVNYRAFKAWTEQYQSLDTCIIRPPDETDQDNLPDLVSESQWFKKCLYNAAVDKLNGIANIIENATGLLYPNSTLVDTIIAKDSRLTPYLSLTMAQSKQSGLSCWYLVTSLLLSLSVTSSCMGWPLELNDLNRSGETALPKYSGVF